MRTPQPKIPHLAFGQKTKMNLHAAYIPLFRLLTTALFTFAEMGRTSGATNQTAVGSPVHMPEVRDALTKLDLWLEGQRMKHDLPGFSVGVIHDQELVWSKGYGYADVTNKIPATDQTLYRVGSITKTFTAAAVMQLVEQGKLSLDHPVQKHLAWFTPEGTNPEEPIRVWHLLSHTSGLLREAPGMRWDEFRAPDAAELRASTRTSPLSTPTQLG